MPDHFCVTAPYPPPMLEPALDWATAAGPPNWLFVVALLTSPALWAKQIKQRVTPLLDRWLPAAE